MKIKLIITICIFAVIVCFVGLRYYFAFKNTETPIACTQEAKLCPEANTRTVKLYYYNPALDQDESGNTLCGREGLVAVERKIPISKTPIQDTIKLLISGQLTEAEKSRGIATEYPLEGFSLKGASLKDGILTLEFKDFNYKTAGGSCRVGILRFQIEATAKQFSEVQQVRFLPEELFQP